MKRFFVLFFLLPMIMFGLVQGHDASDDYSFYLKIGSGISSAQSANIVAVYPPWNPAIQGYDASLGHCPIASFSVGCQLFQVADLEVSISNRSMFEYRQYQTSTNGDGSYTREFDVSVTPILFSANILGLGIPHFHWDTGCGKMYPIVGASIGVSNILMTNYRTTGLPASGDSAPYLSFSSENQYYLCQNFTYAVLAGVEYNHHDRWAIGTGYRWLNAGDFTGPQYQRVGTGAAVDLGDDQWQIRFQANEWFIEFKIFI